MLFSPPLVDAVLMPATSSLPGFASNFALPAALVAGRTAPHQESPPPTQTPQRPHFPKIRSRCALFCTVLNRAFQLPCFLFPAFQRFDAAEERHVSLADAVALLLPIRAGHDPEPWRTSVLKLLRRTRCPLRLLFLPRRFPLIPRFLNKLRECLRFVYTCKV